PHRPLRGRVRADLPPGRRRGGGGRRHGRGGRRGGARGGGAGRGGGGARGAGVGGGVVLAGGAGAARPPSPELVRELQDHVKLQTAPYKYPRIIDFVAELPKTSSGKVRRAELRAQAPPPPRPAPRSPAGSR